MILLPEKDLHRLRQMRDDLEWLQKVVEAEVYKNQPWRHYTTTIASTRGVIGSLIRNIEWDQKEREPKSYTGDTKPKVRFTEGQLNTIRGVK